MKVEVLFAFVEYDGDMGYSGTILIPIKLHPMVGDVSLVGDILPSLNLRLKEHESQMIVGGVSVQVIEVPTVTQENEMDRQRDDPRDILLAEINVILESNGVHTIKMEDLDIEPTY